MSSDIYKNIGSDDAMSEFYKYALISAVTKSKLNTVPVLSDDTIKKIRLEEHTPVIDKILLMFAAGIISEDVTKELCLNSKETENDIIVAEKRIIAELNLPNEDKLSNKSYSDILVCCCRSHNDELLEPLSFDTVMKIKSEQEFTIVDGYVKASDYKTFSELCDLGIRFGNLDKNKIYSETEENLSMIKENEYNCKDKSVPFILNADTAITMLLLHHLTYGKDFLAELSETNEKLRYENYDNLKKTYDDYMASYKMLFEINAYRRKRYVCGRIANWFDYVNSIDSNNPTENFESDYHKIIKMETTEYYTDEELLKKAVEKFRKIYTLTDNTVIEVFHMYERKLFIVSKNEAKIIDSDDFNKILFDFNKVWETILKCSRDGKIKIQGNTVIIPDEYKQEINPSEWVYAEKIIKLQISLKRDQRSSSFKTLKEITGEALKSEDNGRRESIIDEKKEEN